MIKFSDIKRINEIKNLLDNIRYLERGDSHVIPGNPGVTFPKEHSILMIESYRKSLVTELETNYGIKYDE